MGTAVSARPGTGAPGLVAGTAGGVPPIHPSLLTTIARLLAQRGEPALPGVLALVRDAVGGSTALLREVLVGGVDGPVHASAGTPRSVPVDGVSLELGLRAGGRIVGLLVVAGVAVPAGVERDRHRLQLAHAMGTVADVLALALLGLQSHPARLAESLLEGADADADDAAGELHDGPIQCILAAKVALQMPGAGEELAEAVGEALTTTRRALARLQSRVHRVEDLPDALGHLGLQFGLTVVVHNTLDAYLDGHLDGASLTDRPPAPQGRSAGDRAAALYRIAQASASDALSRGAGTLELTVSAGPGWLQLQSSDDGAAGLARHPALLRWVSRATLLGGRLDLTAAGGLTARLPLGREALL